MTWAATGIGVASVIGGIGTLRYLLWRAERE